jgi:hypothetical protein
MLLVGIKSEIFISWKGEMTLWVVQKILMSECVEK